MHGVSAQVEAVPLKLTDCPTVGEEGFTAKLAVGGAGGGGTAATGEVGAELTASDPPSLLAVTVTRIMCPASLAASV